MATPTDALGIAHPPATGEARIVSLVPSLTELLFDLGLGGQVVGRTRYCVHPQPAVKAVPAVGGTKKISRARLLGLRPTHLLVNVDENPRELGESLAGPIPATGNTNTRGRFPPDVAGFLKNWSLEGPTHHFALGVGHIASQIEDFARCWGIECVNVTDPLYRRAQYIR